MRTRVVSIVLLLSIGVGAAVASAPICQRWVSVHMPVVQHLHHSLQTKLAWAKWGKEHPDWVKNHPNGIKRTRSEIIRKFDACLVETQSAETAELFLPMELPLPPGDDYVTPAIPFELPPDTTPKVTEFSSNGYPVGTPGFTGPLGISGGPPVGPPSAPTPEPSSVWLFIAGLGFATVGKLGMMRLRKVN
jgi:hypothetical protein